MYQILQSSKELMYCGSVRLCQFDRFWIPFNTTNRVIRVAWIALNAKLTFLGPYLQQRKYNFTRGYLFALDQLSHRREKVKNVTQLLGYTYDFWEQQRSWFEFWTGRNIGVCTSIQRWHFHSWNYFTSAQAYKCFALHLPAEVVEY